MSRTSPPPGARQTGHKAIIAAVLAGLTSLFATVHGRPDLDTMPLVDWLIVLLGALITGMGAYLLPNRPK